MKESASLVRDKKATEANVAFYREQGYLVAPGLFSEGELAALRKETAAIFRGERGDIEGLLPVEESEDDEAVLKKYVAVHFPHEISPLIREALFHPPTVAILTQIIGANVKCMQSMLFVKGPGKAGQSWHQDEFYIPTRDKSLTGVWIAIDDATVENGCLWIIPGSHKAAYIMPRTVNWSREYADVDTVDVSGFAPADIIPIEVSRGSVVFFNGYTLHSSLRNKTASNFRTALVNHYMRAESMLPWDQDGKLPPTEDLRDIVLVAGTDPYAHKPLTDINRPYLRPEVLAIKTNA